MYICTCSVFCLCCDQKNALFVCLPCLYASFNKRFLELKSNEDKRQGKCTAMQKKEKRREMQSGPE